MRCAKDEVQQIHQAANDQAAQLIADAKLQAAAIVDRAAEVITALQNLEEVLVTSGQTPSPAGDTEAERVPVPHRDDPAP